ncbi:uncharacterized protein N7498_003172 [Penicillium cinerascens]|uniref:Uncharacterized protein n=1 Tax=Penicillium cinerascens TaxID=70096 RepID=A0A9W9N1P0_9EURO|nr:uncharacterized protein N7498_003172 [Penicillium cinerascens]KAJ5211526.1 hypothetical protein N7498_003172 [Penicillium cinerascens]
MESLKADIARDTKARERTKGMSHHPGIVSLAHALRENGKGGLSKLDAEVKKQAATYEEVAGRLKKTLHLAPPSLGSDTVAKLEAELMEKLKAEYDEREANFLKKVEADNANFKKTLKAEYDDREARLMEKLEAQLMKKFEASFTSKNNSLEQSDTAKLQEAVGKWEDELNKVTESMKYVANKYSDLRQKVFDIEVWKSDLSANPQSDQDIEKAARERAEEAIGKIAVLEKDLATLQTELDGFKSNSNPPAGVPPGHDARLSIVEQHQSTLQALDNQVRENTAAISALRSQLEESSRGQQNQISRLDNQYARLEGNATTLSTNLGTRMANRQPSNKADLTQTVQSIKSSHGSLASTVNTLTESLWHKVHKLEHDTLNTSQAAQRCLEQNQSVSDRALLCEKTINSLIVAIRSLETRYSNITTEYLHNHILQAMTERFPSMEKQGQDIQALKEQLTSLADQYLTRVDFGKEVDVLKDGLDKSIDALKDGIVKNIDALRLVKNDPDSNVMNDAVKHVEELSSQIQRTQKEQAAELVKRLEDHNDLRNHFETLSPIVADLAEKVSDLSKQNGEVKGVGSEFEWLGPRLADIQKQLNGFKASCSPQTINKICQQMLEPTEARILTQIQDVHSLSDMLAKQYSDIKSQDFGYRRVQKPFQPQSNGSHSGSDRDNGTFMPPQAVQRSPRDLPGVPWASTVPRPTTATPTDPDTPSIQAPQESRSVSNPSSPATASQPSYRSFQIKDKPSQQETGNSHAPSHNQSLDSRVAPSRPPVVKVSRPPSRFNDPPNIALQNTSGSSKQNKKRKRRLSILGSQDDTSPDIPMAGDDSPAPSSTSYTPRKKKKGKKDKKDKRPTQLK